MAFLPNWLIGALLSIVGSIFSNFGVNIQKYSAMQEEDKPDDEIRGYCQQPLWVIGFGFVAFGSLFDFAALGFAAQSVVATVGSVTLCANIIFAHFWLGEALSKLDIFGTVLIVSGSALAVAFGDQTEITYTLDDLKNRYIAVEFVIYIIISGGIMLFLLTFIRVAEPLRDRIMTAKKDLAKYAEEFNVKMIIDAEKKYVKLQDGYKKYEKIHPFAYCALAGFFGSLVLIFAKSTAEMIRSTAEGNNQFFEPLTYVFIIGMVTCIVIETHFLATALKYFDALYVVPVFQCFFITLGASAGGVYFGEFSRFGTKQKIFFPVGVTITLMGVWLLTTRNMGGDTKATVESKKSGFVGDRGRRTTASAHRARSDLTDAEEVNLHEIDDDSVSEVDGIDRRISGVTESEMRDTVPELGKSDLSLRIEINSSSTFSPKSPPPRADTTPVRGRHSRRPSRSYHRVMEAQSRMFSGGSMIFSQLAQFGVRRVIDHEKLSLKDRIEDVVADHMHKRQRSQSMTELARPAPKTTSPRNINTAPAKAAHKRVRSATDRPDLFRNASSPYKAAFSSNESIQEETEIDLQEKKMQSSSQTNSPIHNGMHE